MLSTLKPLPSTQSVPSLINRTDGERNTLKDRFPLPCVIDMLGSESFGGDSSTPWATMLSGIRKDGTWLLASDWPRPS